MTQKELRAIARKYLAEYLLVKRTGKSERSNRDASEAARTAVDILRTQQIKGD